MSPRDLSLLSIVGVLISCAVISPGPDPERLAATIVAQTEEAKRIAANRTATAEAEQPEPTATLTATALPSPTPTEAPSPAPTGPVSIQDNFSRDSGIWAGCDYCTVEDGLMHLGPFPVSHAFQQNWAICDPCGMVSTFRISVDVSFVEGPSERGYGLVLNLNEEEFYTYEITPWQTIDFWHYDFQKDEWEWVNGTFAGSVKTGNQTNTIQLEASRNSSGRVDYSLGVNGRTPLVIFNRSGEPGWVGLTLYGHAVEVLIDNFNFETEETPRFPTGEGTESG